MNRRNSSIAFLGCLLLAASAAWSAPRVDLKVVNGRPTVLEDGKPLNMAAYDNSIHRGREDWRKRVDNMIDAGVKVFHLTPMHYGTYGQTRFWTDEGVYPSPPADPGAEAVSMEYQATYILGRVPDARFVVRLRSYAPTAWAAKNPGELQTDGDGKTYEPSWASQKYLDGVRGHYTNLVGWVEKQPWGGRVLAYYALPYGEGITLLALNGHFFDHSAAMQAAWHAWLLKKYSTDAALQVAWGDTTVQRATAPIPSDADLRRKIDTLPTWPDPAALQRERDYVLLQREIFGRYVATFTGALKDACGGRALVGLDAMKQPCLGWQHNEAFFGGGRGTSDFSLFAASGSLGVGDLLDLPSLDCLVTPADYTARGIGWGFEGEGLSDSLTLRGKTLVVENDARTWLAREVGDPYSAPLGSFMTLPAVHAGLLRNSAQQFSRGLSFYYTDINYQTSYYTEPTIQREITLNKDLFARATAWPHRETEHAIAMIIDDESGLYSNFTTGFDQLAVLRQRIEGLALAGIPYRIYLLSDLKKDNFPAYRCYLFPNLFKVDSETLALLKRKVFRDGRIAIFGPGTGITDGKTISAEGAQRLLGFSLKLHEGKASRRIQLARRGNSVLSDKQLPALFGDSYTYGPILAPDREKVAAQGVKVLGDLVSSWQVNAPGLVLKEFGRGAAGNGQGGPRGADDYAVVFSASVPLPAALLRDLAKYGGCNGWANEDAVVAASESMVSVHSADGGTYTVQLPRRVGVVRDAVTGKVVARNVRAIAMKLAAPDTKIYTLE